MDKERERLMKAYEDKFGSPFPLRVLRGPLDKAIKEALDSGEEYKYDGSDGRIY